MNDNPSQPNPEPDPIDAVFDYDPLDAFSTEEIFANLQKRGSDGFFLIGREMDNGQINFVRGQWGCAWRLYSVLIYSAKEVMKGFNPAGKWTNT